MIFTRPKQSKSETPTRPIHAIAKITPLLGVSKKSDPFLKQLKEVYDKQNIHPNVKDLRTKSYHLKADQPQNRSPIKKAMNLKNPHKNANANPPTQIRTSKDNDAMNSHSKFSQSTEYQKGGSKGKGSNRKSTEKDDPQIAHFQDEYYPSKEEKRQKKMKVTLKDIKKQRKSMQQSDGDYLSKINGDTRQSISQDSLARPQNFKNQFAKNQNMVEEFNAHNSEQYAKSEIKTEYYCLNHHEKRATHLLLDSNSSEQQCYCQKCAVDFATKGYQITQISNNRLPTRKYDVREQRIAELKDFLFELDKMEPIFKRTTRKIQSYRLFLINKFDEEHKKLDVYYNSLLTVIQNSYITSQNSLKLYHNAIVEEIDSNLAIADQKFKQISIIKEDIVPNINSIIEETQVQEESFKIVIDNHYSRLQQIQLLMRDISCYNYDCYQFKFQSIDHLLANLRGIITPILQRQHFDCTFQTQRKTTQNSEQKWFDPFRMSFGKNNNSAYRL